MSCDVINPQIHRQKYALPVNFNENKRHKCAVAGCEGEGVTTSPHLHERAHLKPTPNVYQKF